MSRISWINGAAILAALVASVLAAARDTPRRAIDQTAPALEIDIAEAHRIVSASTVADVLLLELCAPERIIAVTALSADGAAAHRFQGLATIRSLDDVEAIVALRPDLLITHNVADPRRAERVRAAGPRVLDLGTLEGRASLGEDARTIGALCGSPEAGQRWALAFERRMDAVARDIPADARRNAIYLSIWGDRFLGGTVGSSYHDVLEAAGLVDAAADNHRGWPAYAVEQILELDPDVIVTRDGMADVLCGHPVLSRLRACPDAMVEVDQDLLDDPGPGMLEAAETIRAAVYPGALSPR